MKTRDYIIIAVVVVVIVVIIVFGDKIKALFTRKSSPTQPVTTTQQQAGLDYNKLLKKGVYNSPEVKLLQEWLGGLDNDGDFGPLTETRLQEKKGVTQTTLKQYGSTPDVQQQISGAGGEWKMVQPEGFYEEQGLTQWSDGKESLIGPSITGTINWYPQ